MENHDNTTEQSFKELFEGQEEVKIYHGKRIKGKVISASEEQIAVNINYKADGILLAAEYRTPEMYKEYNPGDDIEAFVKAKNDGVGQVLLTMKSQRQESNNQQRHVDPIFLDEEKWKNRVFDAVVKDLAKKGETIVGVSAIVEGTRVFIPAQHLSLSYVSDFTEYVGKTLQVKIITVTKKEGYSGVSIVASAKEVLSEQMKEKKREALSKLEEGQKITGKVSHIETYGAFVDIEEGVGGLLPIKEISWVPIKTVADVLKVGQEIEVIVSNIDLEKLRLTFGHKQLTPQPWDNVEEKYPVGSTVECTVVETKPYGAFVQLEPGVKALIPISQIAPKHIETVESEINAGDSVKAKVLESNSHDRRITLSRKEVILEENPELAAEIERERESRMRARQEQHEAIEKQKKNRQQTSENESARRGERREQVRAERRTRREDVDYTIPEEERSTTSLASMFEGFMVTEEGSNSTDENK